MFADHGADDQGQPHLPDCLADGPAMLEALPFDITRAEADPFFTRPQVAALISSYLGDADPKIAAATMALLVRRCDEPEYV